MHKLQVLYMGLYDISFLEDCSCISNGANPDEMPNDAAFHLGLHYLSKYPEYKW